MALPTDNIRGWDDIAENYKDDILRVVGGNEGLYYTSASTTVLSTGYDFCDIEQDDGVSLADVLAMLKHIDPTDQDIGPTSYNWNHFIEALSYYDPESEQGTLSKTSNNGPCMSLRRIREEFNSGATGSVSFSDFYRGGSYVTDNNTGVPASGTIDIEDFYGAVKIFTFTISTNTEEANLSTLATAAGWNGTDPVSATISSGVYLWSDDTSVGGLTIPSSMNGLVTITNNGYIIGRGGNAGQAGGPALVNNATGVTLTNASGAFIAGGGGGGGGRGGGGAGGGDGAAGFRNSVGTLSGGTGGAVGQAGTSAQGAYSGGSNGGAGQGGGAGGGGGGGSTWFDPSYGGGGGGGRILPGTGGAGGSGDPSGPVYGGAGGGSNTAGSSGSSGGGGGGGGWGAAGGGSGGAGGAAISGTAIATYTNNGTVYGSTA